MCHLKKITVHSFLDPLKYYFNLSRINFPLVIFFPFQIHKINDVCWDTCIDSVGSSLSGRNENCLRNCAERFVDTTLLVTTRFQQLAQKMQGGGM